MQDPKPDLKTRPAAPALIGRSDVRWRGAPSYPCSSEQSVQSYFYQNLRLLWAGQQNKTGKLHYYEIYLHIIRSFSDVITHFTHKRNRAAQASIWD